MRPQVGGMPYGEAEVRGEGSRQGLGEGGSQAQEVNIKREQVHLKPKLVGREPSLGGSDQVMS